MAKWLFVLMGAVTLVPALLVNFSEALTAKMVIVLCLFLMYLWGYFHGVWRNV